MAKLVNCTPHDVTVAGVTFAPSGTIPRLAQETVQVGTVTVDGTEIPLTETQMGALDGLPEPQDDAIYVVSRLVAEAAPERTDLLVPGRAVRDEQGRVIGVESLSRLSQQPADDWVDARALLPHLPPAGACAWAWGVGVPLPSYSAALNTPPRGGDTIDDSAILARKVDEGRDSILDRLAAGQAVYVELPGGHLWHSDYPESRDAGDYCGPWGRPVEYDGDREYDSPSSWHAAERVAEQYPDHVVRVEWFDYDTGEEAWLVRLDQRIPRGLYEAILRLAA